MQDRATLSLLKHGIAIAKECGARAIFLPWVVARQTGLQLHEEFSGSCVFLAQAGVVPEIVDPMVVCLPDVSMTRTSQVKLSTFLAVSRHLVDVGDVVVFLTGDLITAEVDTILIAKIASQSQIFSFIPTASVLSQSVLPEVIARMLDLAVEIGTEGREGKPVGTLFVVGDAERVLSLSRPLVLNPFHGYAEVQRNILDFRLEETIKEFASIDGAFVVRGDGVIEACGMLLKTATSEHHEIPHGLGVRHHVAAGITAVTSALAIAVSESTGSVTVFMGGHSLIQIEKPRRTRQRRRKRSGVYFGRGLPTADNSEQRKV